MVLSNLWQPLLPEDNSITNWYEFTRIYVLTDYCREKINSANENVLKNILSEWRI